MSTQRVSDDVNMIDAPYHGRTGVLGTYVVAGEKVAVIDPGPVSQVPSVIKALDRLGVKEVSTIALTHIHLDHAAGCWMMLERYPGAEVHCHPRGVDHMVDPSKILAAAREAFGDKIEEYGEIRGIPREKLKTSVDGERLCLAASSSRSSTRLATPSTAKATTSPRAGCSSPETRRGTHQTTWEW